MALVLDAVYLLLILAASPWLVWQAWRHGKYRAGWGAKLLGRVPPRRGSQPVAWFHAVSVGEVNLLGPLVAEMSRRLPAWEFVISTTTTTGYELARRKYPHWSVFYCPLDFSWAVRRALTRLRPQLLVLCELELWPNLIRQARLQGAAVAVINGRLSERSFRGYRRLGRWVWPWLAGLDLVAVQNDEYAQRFLALGARPERVHVTGSIKFDGARGDRNDPQVRALAHLAGIAEDDIVLLAGSTQEPEEALALATFRELATAYPRLRLIVVPRHAERFEAVARLLSVSGLQFARRSALSPARPAPPTARVVLVDAIGELAAWWGLAEIAFVGGSLGSRGGQNMIEPSAYGAAVAFGPNTRNFRDVVSLLLEARAARVVRDGAELTAFVRNCLDDPAAAREMGGRARHLVATQVGATRRTCEMLLALVEPSAENRPAGRASHASAA